MGWFTAHPNLSLKTAEMLESMAYSGASEAASIAQALNEIASNDTESAQDEFLAACAEELAHYAMEVANALQKPPAPPITTAMVGWAKNRKEQR